MNRNRQVRRHYSRGYLSLAMFFILSLGLSSFALAKSHQGMASDMAYVPFGMAIIGLDKDPSQISMNKNEPPSLFQRRMSMPWSKEAFHDEGPAHWVLLRSYLIDKFEVSNSQYEEFMRATGHAAPAYWDDPRLNKPDQPVVGVNYDDATAFCEWKGKRLPTEAEWENAARGPNGFRYPWGNEFDPSKANYGKKNSATLPVDSLPSGKSGYGLHHMAGNVFEWVSDWYDPSYYSKGPFPPNPAGPAKPVWLGGTGTYVDRLTTGAKRVIRGGSWIAGEHSITTTHRFWNHPQNNSYGVGLGFRCAKDSPTSMEQDIRYMTIEAMKRMGRERYTEAGEYVDRALMVDPTNEDLLRLKDLIDKSQM